MVNPRESELLRMPVCCGKELGCASVLPSDWICLSGVKKGGGAK